MSLGPRDERLLELLVATGHLAADQAEVCRAELATRPGPRVPGALRELLISRQLVGEDALEELFGDEEDRARSGTGRRSGVAPRSGTGGRSGQGLRSDAAPVLLVPPAVPRDPPEAPPEPAGPVEPPDEPTHPDEDSAQALEEEVRRRAALRASRSGLRRVVSGRRGEVQLTAPPSRSPGEEADGEVSTRRFDPAALAAASLPRRRLHRPGLIAAAALALLLLLFGALGRREDDPGPPERPPEEGQPVEPGPSDPPDGGLDLPGLSDPLPVAPPPPPDPFPGALERARELLAGEEYLRAREGLEALPAEVRVAHEAQLGPLLLHLRDLEAFQTRVEAARREAAELRAAGNLEAAVERLSELLQADSALQESPTGRRLAEDLLELRLAAAEEPPPVEGPPPRADWPPPEALEAQARRGRQLVQLLQERIRQDKEAQDRLEQAEEERAREATLRAPLDLEIVSGYLLQGATIKQLDRRGVTLEAKGDQLHYEWSALPREVALRLRRLAVRDDQGQDHLRLGVWCLGLHLFDDARQAFQRAVQLDPRLISKVPDAASIARASRVFAGELTHSGTSVHVEWEFARAGELSDWQAEPGARLELRDGRLRAGGAGMFLARLSEVGFQERVELTATLGGAAEGASHVLGLAFAAGTAGERAWLIAVSRQGDLALLERAAGAERPTALEVAPAAAAGGSVRVTLEVEGQRLRVRVKNQTVIRAQVDPEWERVRVLLGGHTRRRSGNVAFEAAQLKGRVRADWLRKSFGELDRLLTSIQARLDELPVFAEPPGRPAPTPLSAEEAPDHARAPHPALEAYRRGTALLDSGDLVAALQATRELSDALDRAPQLVAARYQLARAFELLGRPRQALAELERALLVVPAFHEAIAVRARLYSQLGTPTRAREEADAALALRPDHAPAWSARARARFLQGDLPGALADLELAQALDPWDAGVRAARRNVGHVLRGPRWTRSFEVQTPHYLVRTDISQRRCQEYADLLEAARAFFARRFELASEPSGAADRKATVLIFDTREGFQAYAELTTDDRVESLLGCYLPRYGQLLLYEDKDDPSGVETRRVLCHEGFHQFMDRLGCELPFWLNEGLAEYFAPLRIDGRGEVVDVGTVLPGRQRDLRQLLGERGRPLSFERLMQEGPQEFYSGPVAAKYAQAWAMVRWLEGEAPEPLRRRYAQYVRSLRQGTHAAQAFREAWGGTDWGEAERAFRSWAEGS